MTVDNMIKLLEKVQHKESKVWFRSKEDFNEVEFISVEHQLSLDDKDHIIVVLEGEE